jgi:GAF domain-containing protein
MTTSETSFLDAKFDESTERSLLQSVSEVTRIVSGAAATSIFLIDRRTNELVFEAVSGAGEDDLVGKRFPSNTGIAGYVAMSAEPMMVDDVDDSAHFAREAAESTGYVPRSIIAAPLIRNGECVGVLEVLDCGSQPHSDLADVELVGLLATQAALGLDMLLRLRWLSATAGSPPSGIQQENLDRLNSIAMHLPSAQEPVVSAVSKLLATASEMILMTLT